LRAEGRHVGIGIACYVEGTGIGPYEGAKIQVQANGKVIAATGIGTQGQGHFTSFAQIVADQVGVDVRDVDVVTGDTDQFYWGAGTFASRGAVVAGNAMNEAAKVARENSADCRRALSNATNRTPSSPTAWCRSWACLAARGTPRRARDQGQSDARRGAAGHRARPGGDPIFRSAARRHRERRPRHDRRDRSGDDGASTSADTSWCTIAAR
jgi:CO/xanthine dehydrogenase Mo-binding subunit